ncbi:ATP-binding protein [Actinoplanes bogorensis]|uniref:ATP-binding protein n=1 Tax=Paractinoplanes bogorensis TaxID=1610840 RepID=A0ABS5YUX4_9ACTN|nr:ATP-binding protein [Actinoplanes bogorensis]MBU2666513.1 ATP-binding protein [Actinoplanes bogorensis]
MRMTLRLDLPREAGSVPTVRRMLRSALAVLQVDRGSQDDLEIAITEACSNVVRHAGGAETFEVCLDVAEKHCSIDVRDTGDGFDPEAVGPAGPASESGRGLALIKALGENVRMHSTPRRGSLIHFEKSFA